MREREREREKERETKKTHIFYLKSQIFFFFSEALSIDKASEKRRNICDFK